MGVRGPIPKSAEARQYEGGAAHRPLPAARGQAHALGIPEQPKGMTTAARHYWDFYTEQMTAYGTLRPIDGPCLEMICERHADWQQLQKDKRKLLRQRKAEARTDGRKVSGSVLLEFEMSGEGRRLASTIAGIFSQLKQLCDRYGLNPLAGSRLQSADGGYPIAPRMPGAGFPAETNDLEVSIQ